MNWKDQFKDHTTSTAFSLRLSNHMCTLLYYINEGMYYEYRQISRDFCTPFRALERRGLAEWNPECRAYKQGDEKPEWVYRLTPAGKCTLKLLIMADVVQESKNMKRSKAA
jgi:hypothetical protein